jgi:hypothetical protein
MAPLITSDEIKSWGKEIDDLAFAFIAPLGAKDDDVALAAGSQNAFNCSAGPPRYLKNGMLRFMEMQLTDAYLALGEARFEELLRRISIGRLRTYQLFDQIKARTRLMKLNSEHLRKAAPRLWERLKEHDANLATDLAQAILVSNLDMIIETLDLLGIPHQDGFFAKDADTAKYLTESWQSKAFEALKGKYSPSVLAFYLNHLAVETGTPSEAFVPSA